jgi:hypothetical protein
MTANRWNASRRFRRPIKTDCRDNSINTATVAAPALMKIIIAVDHQRASRGKANYFAVSKRPRHHRVPKTLMSPILPWISSFGVTPGPE